ncbi:hypothetical protein D3C81_2059520 [compost metagenome]
MRLLQYTPLLYTDSEATRITKFSAEATTLLSRLWKIITNGLLFDFTSTHGYSASSTTSEPM